MSVLPTWRLVACVAFLVPLSLLGAFSRPLGYLSLGFAALFLLVLAVDAAFLFAEPIAQLRVVRPSVLALEVGVPTTVCLELTNRGQRRLRVALSDGCPEALQPSSLSLRASLAPGETRELAYDVLPRVRGPVRFGPTEVRVEGRMGMALRRVRIPVPGEFRVHPDLRALRGGSLRARRSLLQSGSSRRTRSPGRDGDFERLRDFVAGDDLRHVDWKATARLQRPITRLYRAEKAQTLMILVDASRLMASPTEGRTKMDLAVEAALHLAWAGLSRGDRVGVTVFDDGIRSRVTARAGLAQFGRILGSLYDQQPKLRVPRYRRAARDLLLHQRRRSLVVWITDLLDVEQGEELLAALKALRGRHLSLVVAQDDPGAHRLANADPSRPSGFFGRVVAAEALSEREALVGGLCRGGARVVTSGAARLSAAAVDEYLAVKQSGRL